MAQDSDEPFADVLPLLHEVFDMCRPTPGSDERGDSRDPEDLHHLVAEVVNNLHRDHAGSVPGYRCGRVLGASNGGSP